MCGRGRSARIVAVLAVAASAAAASAAGEGFWAGRAAGWLTAVKLAREGAAGATVAVGAGAAAVVGAGAAAAAVV